MRKRSKCATIYNNVNHKDVNCGPKDEKNSIRMHDMSRNNILFRWTLVYAIVVILCILGYENTLSGDFVYDDRGKFD